MAREGRKRPLGELIARLRRKGIKPALIGWPGKDDSSGVLGGGAEAPARRADLDPETLAKADAEFAKRRREEAERMGESGRPLDEPDDQGIKPVMTEDEMREAGVVIDLPSEGASSDPKPLRYSDGKGLGFPGAIEDEDGEESDDKPEPPRRTPEL